jgi:indole-3-glycerol phosphate synthase
MNILETIVEFKREELARRKQEMRPSSLRDMPHSRRQTLPLGESLRKAAPFAIIAEIKRSSPSGGSLREDCSPAEIAGDYACHGAAAVSVLTDRRFFGGSLEDLAAVRETAGVPVLRKEFIVDDYQITEAKAYGADAVLLIAAILDKSQLGEYVAAAAELQLEPLVELYDVREIDKLDFDRMRLIGINNRNLKTLEVDFRRSIGFRTHLPASATVVSESGITSGSQLKLLREAGVHAALIGEHLMKAASPGEALAALLEEVGP